MPDPVTGTLAAVGVGGSIIGGNKAAKATTQAANTAAEAQYAGIASQERMFDKSVALQQPWRQAGVTALGEMTKLLGQSPERNGITSKMQQTNALARFRTDPGYQVQMDEGQKAIERSAAARGMQMSGANLKGLTRYSQGVADQSYGNYWNRLAGIAGVGQTATNQMGNAALSTGQGIAGAYGNIGNAAMAAGQGRASAYANTASSVNSGINNALFAYGVNQRQQFPYGTADQFYGTPGAGYSYGNWP